MTDDAGDFASSELVDALPCGVLITDIAGTIVRTNKTFCVWVGLESGDIVGKKKLQDFFTMGGRIFHQTHWTPALQMQGSLAEVKLGLTQRRRDRADDAQCCAAPTWRTERQCR